MARWRRLARTGNRLLACAVGGVTTKGDSLWTEPRFLAIHPLYEKRAVEVHNSDLAYVRVGDVMSFNPKFRRPSYSITENGQTTSVTREIIVVGSLAPMDEQLPYRENGLNIDDLNSHGVSENRYPSAGLTRYTFGADFIFHTVGTRTNAYGQSTPIDYYSSGHTSVTVEFDWDSGDLRPYKPEPTQDEIDIMGPYWDVGVIDDDSMPPIRVERGMDTTEYVYEAVDDADFPVGKDYQRSA